MEEKLYYIWLSLCFSYGGDKPNEIASRFDSLAEFYAYSEEAMQGLGFLSKKDIDSIKHTSIKRAELIVEDCKKLAVDIITMGDELYPKRLRLIYGPPLVLYCQGDMTDIDNSVAIAVVGTRHPVEYTREATMWISANLARAGAIIVSGCAVGIDAAAHFGALKGKGRTIGVLGCGSDVNYPPENQLLKAEMLKRGGAIITEIPPGTSMPGPYFPVRNRIIAGLSLGVLVTQAPVRSGSLITAEHALEQGKEVYCLPPYSVLDLSAMGVMKYIRDGSTVVACADDILMDFYYAYADKLEKSKLLYDYISQKRLDGKAERISVVKKETPRADMEKTVSMNAQALEQQALQRAQEEEKLIGTLDETQTKVYHLLGVSPRFVDELSTEAQINVGLILSALTELEIMGLAVSYGGRRYSLPKGVE